MHYRNGREAKNGDKVVELNSEGKVVKSGTLVEAVAGNDYCNGQIVTSVYGSPVALVTGACLVDCLHVDDVAVILAEKGLEKRPDGK
jgi:hypothetical protein